MIDFIIFHEQINNSELFLRAIYQHLLSGYSNQLKKDITEYKEKLENLGLNKLGRFPLLSDCSNLKQPDIPIEKILGFEFYGESLKDFLNNYELPTTIKKDTVHKLVTLRNRIITELNAILFKTEMGIPLEGICDFCPKKNLKIIKEN